MKVIKQDALQIIDKTPLVSIDLIVKDRKGKILLGERVNEPAKGYWFVPGGRIRKNEKIAAAFGRIIGAELGLTKEIAEAVFMVLYEHFYSENFLEAPNVSTHYVVLAYEADLPEDQKIQGDEQHNALKWFTIEEILQEPQVHRYTKQYFR